MKKPDNLEPIDRKLYNLIYDRTVTSHMKPCENLIYKVTIINDWIKNDGYFTASHKRMMYPGFKIYFNKDLKREDKPEIVDSYHLETSISTEKYENMPQYYDESSIVSLLEKTGIGRPSTYSTIVSTLDNRKYTEKDIIKKKIKK